MSKSKKLIAILLILTLAISIAASLYFVSQNYSVVQNNYKEAIVQARTEMWQTINSGGDGSGSIAILDNGQIVYSEGFGMADRENSIPVDSNTLFNIGSISKTYCAAAVMLLVDDGKVKLADPVTKYLPDFVMADPRYKDITVRMLLNHASGLPGTAWSNTLGYETNPTIYQDLLSALSVAHLKATPGEMAPYTNDGFTLAEMVVARVSGESYMDFLSQRIFNPLSLDHTGLSVGEQSNKTIAYYYSPNSGIKDPPQVLSLLGAGGLSSTAEDLVRFADSFSRSGKHILSQSSIDEIMKPQPSAFAIRAMNETGINPEFQYGLGLDFAGLPSYNQIGINVIGKGGDVEDYHGMLISAPEQRLSVAVLVAGRTNGAEKIAFDALNAVLQQKGLMQKEDVPVSNPSIENIPSQYASFVGYYAPNYRVSFNFDVNVCVVETLGTSGVWTTAFAAPYRDNYFYIGETQFYFISVDAQDYLLVSYFSNSAYFVYGQRLKEVDNPLSLRIDMNGTQWLRRNVQPYEATTTLAPPYVVVSTTIDGLPGYVAFNKIKEVDSPDHAGMPSGAVRDQTELTLIDKDGQVWAQAYDVLYSPVSVAKPLQNGVNTATIGSSGYNEWFKVSQDAVLSFQVSAKDKVTVFSPDGSPVYDSALFKGDVFVPQGSFVEMAGNPGDTFIVTAK